jgi:hypothetical protein
MKLSYTNILGDGKRHTISATITTEHSLSSYGQPVLLLEDGNPLNVESWILMAYQVVNATNAEYALLQKWVGLINTANAAAALGRKGGSVTSKAKTAANRAKANLPPMEGKRPRGRPKKEK